MAKRSWKYLICGQQCGLPVSSFFGHVHQQTGRYQVEIFVHSSKVDLALVPHYGHQNPLSAYSRSAEHQGQPVKMQVSGDRDRVVSKSLCGRIDLGPWGRPHIDLFTTRDNCKLPTFVSPFPDKMAWAMEAMSILWKGMWAYAFPLVPKVLSKIRKEPVQIILLVPWWPKRVWSLEVSVELQGHSHSLINCCCSPD